MNLQGIQQQAQGMMTQPHGQIPPGLAAFIAARRGGQAPGQLPGQAPGQPPVPPQPPQASALPPQQVLLQLAQEAQSLDPVMLGALVFHALKEGGQPLNMQGINNLSR